MAFGTEGTQGTTEAASAATESTPSQESQSTGYSVTDPGYDSFEPGEAEDELEALRAENTKSKPADKATAKTSDDASETESDTEETAKTPAGDESADSFEDISDELLDRAIALGYELDDIREFKDAKAFEKELARVERFQQRLQSKKTVSDDTVPGEPEVEQKEPNWDQMIEDGHDPDIIALQKSTWQRAQAAEAEVRQLKQLEQMRAAQAESDRFDDALNGLGDEYEPILGKGRRASLSKETLANRQKVFTKMGALRRGYELSGEPVPPEAELIQEAVQASFYKQTQQFARNAIKKQIKNAGSQALSRPRSGSSKELAGPQRALQKEQEFWKKHSD